MIRLTPPLLIFVLLVALHTVSATAAPSTSTSSSPYTSASWTTTLLSRLLTTRTVASAPATASLTSTPALAPATTLPKTAQSVRRPRQRSRGPFCKRSKLVCTFHGTGLGGAGISGSAIFESVRRGRRCAVKVRAMVRGLSPGLHGFHIHTFGDVRGTDGKSAGGHFVGPWNRNAIHGWPWSKRRHWGCLGNINAGKLGKAWYHRLDWRIRIRHIVGRSMIIHAGPDLGPNYQPSGGAGPRVAKCVIGYANPEFKDEL